MSGFRDHFLDKYFAYRRRYVDYVAIEAPHRTRMAVLAEVARLVFVTGGSLLCAVVFLPLVVAAFGRHGYVAAVIFLALGAMSLAFAVLSGIAIGTAWNDPRRVAAPPSRERIP